MTQKTARCHCPPAPPPVARRGSPGLAEDKDAGSPARSPEWRYHQRRPAGADPAAQTPQPRPGPAPVADHPNTPGWRHLPAAPALWPGQTVPAPKQQPSRLQTLEPGSSPTSHLIKFSPHSAPQLPHLQGLTGSLQASPQANPQAQPQSPQGSATPNNWQRGKASRNWREPPLFVRIKDNKTAQQKRWPRPPSLHSFLRHRLAQPE